MPAQLGLNFFKNETQMVAHMPAQLGLNFFKNETQNVKNRD
jgi:hypothetical protein